jgi:hypothetical protein
MSIKIDDLVFMINEGEQARETTCDKRKLQLSVIAEQFCGTKTEINPEIFCDEDFPEEFISWIKSKYKENTQKSYISAICSLSYSVPIPLSCLKKLKAYVSSLGIIGSTTVIDEKYDEKLDSGYGKNTSINMIITIVKYVGPIRLFEIIRTKIVNRDDIHNFLDLENNTWYFTEKSTKNKTARQFYISELAKREICKYIKEGSEFLVLRKNLKPYVDTNSLTILFKNATGISYVQTRKSYIELANRTNDSVYLVELANIMGHKPSTQLTSYSDVPPLGLVVSDVGTVETEVELINMLRKTYIGIVNIDHSVNKHICYRNLNEIGYVCLTGEYILNLYDSDNNLVYKKHMMPGCYVKVKDICFSEFIAITKITDGKIVKLYFISDQKKEEGEFEKKQCLALTRKKQRCRKIAVKDSEYCSIHKQKT